MSSLRPAGALFRRVCSAQLQSRRPAAAYFHFSQIRANEENNASTKPQDQPAQPSAELTQLQEALKTHQARIKELEDKYARSLAEMENVRARSRREVESTKQFGIQSFAKDLLSVADVLRMALDNVPEATRADKSNTTLQQFFIGIEMTEKELIKVFEKNGLKSFDPLGQPFDPNYHNALFEGENPNMAPGTVMFVQKKGYMLHDRALRPAEVGVVKKSS